MSNADVVSAIDIMLALMARASQVGQIVASVQADGRTKLNSAEWAAINTADDVERQRLVDEITKAKGA